MVFSFRKNSPIKNGVILVAFTLIIAVAALLVPSILQGQSRGWPALVYRESSGLGINYLPVTPPIAAHYNLSVDFGALVTEVVPGGSGEQAGVEVGDVILSYNGTKLDEKVPLLGMIMSCPADDAVTLEVWRADSILMVNLFPTVR